MSERDSQSHVGAVDSCRTEVYPLKAASRVAVVVLCLHVVFEYLRVHQIFPILDQLKIQTAFFALLILIVIAQTKKRKVRLARQSRLLLGFLGLMVFTFPLATNWFYAYQFAYGVALILVGYFAITHILQNERDLRIFLGWLVGIHIYLAIKGILGYTEREFTESGYKSTGVVGGSFLGDENDVALALIVVLPFAMYLFREARAVPSRIFWGVGAVAILLTIVLTFSRGGFVGLVAMVLYWVGASRYRGKAIGALALAAILVIAVAPPQYWARISTITQADEGTAQLRQYYWAADRRMFFDSPIWGVGGNNSGLLMPEYAFDFPPEERPNQWGRASHSLYFQLLAEFGLVGVFLIGTVLVSNFRDLTQISALGRNARPSASIAQLAKCLRVSWVGFLVSAAFLSVLGYPHLYYLTALTVVVQRLALEEKNAVTKTRAVVSKTQTDQGVAAHLVTTLTPGRRQR